MDRQQKLILAAVSVLLLLALTVTVLLLLPEKQEFSPPPHDPAALPGEPPLSDEPSRLYGQIPVAEGFTVGACGNAFYKDGTLEVYFSSHASSTVLTRIKVYDESDTLLGESGLVYPGEYLPTVALSSPPSGEKLKLRVLSFEKDTYYSMGSAEFFISWTDMSTTK